MGLALPPARPSKTGIVAKALFSALTSKQALKLEFALVRYVAYAVAAALGIHDHFLGI